MSHSMLQYLYTHRHTDTQTHNYASIHVNTNTFNKLLLNEWFRDTHTDSHTHTHTASQTRQRSDWLMPALRSIHYGVSESQVAEAGCISPWQHEPEGGDK